MGNSDSTPAVNACPEGCVCELPGQTAPTANFTQAIKSEPPPPASTLEMEITLISTSTPGSSPIVKYTWEIQFPNKEILSLEGQTAQFTSLFNTLFPQIVVTLQVQDQNNMCGKITTVITTARNG